jgi:hypothetical protein
MNEPYRVKQAGRRKAAVLEGRIYSHSEKAAGIKKSDEVS